LLSKVLLEENILFSQKIQRFIGISPQSSCAQPKQLIHLDQHWLDEHIFEQIRRSDRIFPSSSYSIQSRKFFPTANFTILKGSLV
jgi:hypothetical protein